LRFQDLIFAVGVVLTSTPCLGKGDTTGTCETSSLVAECEKNLPKATLEKLALQRIGDCCLTDYQDCIEQNLESYVVCNTTYLDCVRLESEKLFKPRH
jgi:hypothetical protein